MKTANTQPQQTAARRARPPVSLPPADIDTRLTLAHIFMDVTLGGDPAVREARQEAARAIAAAGRYAAEAERTKDCVLSSAQLQPHPVLKRAGDLIRRHGWTQGTWADQQGAVCIWQAIRLVAGAGTEGEADAVAVLLDRIRHEFGSDGLSASGWNDRRERTQGDVLRILW